MAMAHAPIGAFRAIADAREANANGVSLSIVVFWVLTPDDRERGGFIRKVGNADRSRDDRGARRPLRRANRDDYASTYRPQALPPGVR